MLWVFLVHLLGFVVDVLIRTRHTDHEQDLQILVLQHQRRLLQRERCQPALRPCDPYLTSGWRDEQARRRAAPRPVRLARWPPPLARARAACLHAGEEERRWRGLAPSPACPASGSSTSSREG